MIPPPDLRSTRRTKIVCTVGPASARRIPQLAAAGMDVARINFSHGTAASHAAAAAAVRRLSGPGDPPLAILTDLSGPKIRLGPLAGGSTKLTAGRPFLLIPAGQVMTPGDASGVGVAYPELAKDVRVGDPVFLADGAAELIVSGVDDDGRVQTEVVRGGAIRSGGGLAIPAARLSSPALTERDLADIPRAIALGATFIGQSFVRAATDVVELRRRLGADGPRIVAKIETRPAVESFDEILDVADAVMVARGDLGVEMPFEQVPLIQKQLLGRALDRGIPTIVATQMLESMTAAARPTRAEASDVANAVFDGADAIMLSAETAIGAYPVEAAETAGRIASRCELDGGEYLPNGTIRQRGTGADPLAEAAVALAATHEGIAAIVCYTGSGRTARILSSLRPRVPIIAFTADPTVAARLALVNGVVPRPTAALAAADRLERLSRLIGDSGLVGDDATVVLLGSTASDGAGADLLSVRRVGRSR